MVMFYERYSEKVFVDCMIDSIIKSKNIEESEAIALYNELTSSLTIEDSVCLNESGASIRQGVIKTLEFNGVDFSKENLKINIS